MAFSLEQMTATIQEAVDHAVREATLESQRRQNELRLAIQQLTSQVNAVQIASKSRIAEAPQVKAYEPIEIRDNVKCDEPLDAVKSLPEFTGRQDAYVSWRQVAVAAYYIFRNYVNSSRHFQAVIIIRSKIRGPADAVLSSVGTVLNFDAIINRLDFRYSDKRPIHAIEQEMGTLRQGNLPLLQYYDEVEKKLTLLTNKATMSYEASAAKVLCDKFRDDALRVFISGLKRSLTDVIFSAKPKDMPSALALAQEVESNRERYAFAASFAKSQEDRNRKQHPMARVRQQASAYTNSQTSTGEKPHYTKRRTPEPMDMDPSLSKMCKPSQAPAFQNRKPAVTDRSGPNNGQRVNHSAGETEVFYKPGKDNLVADSLSKQLYVVEKGAAVTIHRELSITHTIQSTDKPLNCNVEHNRAHRSAQENVKQVFSEYYFPKMAQLANEVVANCKTCAKAKNNDSIHSAIDERPAEAEPRFRISVNTPKISSETGKVLPDKTECSKLAKIPSEVHSRPQPLCEEKAVEAQSSLRVGCPCGPQP
ncbi:hypothetical protein KR074_003218 [Drosophila pseudoananassae]|nr:hypothetical protein KR074_003218 [Drosophila pseudoananassae]